MPTDSDVAVLSSVGAPMHAVPPNANRSPFPPQRHNAAAQPWTAVLPVRSPGSLRRPSFFFGVGWGGRKLQSRRLQAGRPFFPRNRPIVGSRGRGEGAAHAPSPQRSPLCPWRIRPSNHCNGPFVVLCRLLGTTGSLAAGIACFLRVGSILYPCPSCLP